MIDCKSRTTSQTSRRHVVERAAVTAHLQLVAWAQLPLYYVFVNLDLLVPAMRASAFSRVFGAPDNLIAA
ncbi:hypothetical protein [Streptomyces sp. NRRL S-920]|uniref:hypothetical protein n=1 Tax=Streptomyces sp. NRRL S-920 TaxID=1463921 RepID=UPI000566CFD5|nr:hypothetical protein [Streptomyces sp. NRRL S-920]